MLIAMSDLLCSSKNILPIITPEYCLAIGSIVDPFSGSENLPLSPYDYQRYYPQQKFSDSPYFIAAAENKRRRFDLYPGLVPGTDERILPYLPSEYEKEYNNNTVLQIEAKEFARIKNHLTIMRNRYAHLPETISWVNKYLSLLEQAAAFLKSNASLLIGLEKLANFPVVEKEAASLAISNSLPFNMPLNNLSSAKVSNQSIPFAPKIPRSELPVYQDNNQPRNNSSIAKKAKMPSSTGTKNKKNEEKNSSLTEQKAAYNADNFPSANVHSLKPTSKHSQSLKRSLHIVNNIDPYNIDSSNINNRLSKADKRSHKENLTVSKSKEYNNVPIQNIKKRLLNNKAKQKQSSSNNHQEHYKDHQSY